MKKKTVKPIPQFPLEREEFAGELTPGLRPGPVTQAHPARFRKDDSGPAAARIDVEDSGEFTGEE